jgi:acetyl-CoA carboxylase carboxyltransferase component
VPQFCVVVRKAYGAGLYAMGGPGFAPDATLALPTARIAVMGPEAAVNAVYANQIAEVERTQGARPGTPSWPRSAASTRRTSTSSGWPRTSSLDGVVEADELRAELLHRLRYASRRDRAFSERRTRIPPV